MWSKNLGLSDNEDFGLGLKRFGSSGQKGLEA